MKMDLVRRHYGQLLADDTFYQRFYDNFIHSHPQVTRMFTGVRMEDQYKLLRHGVNLLIMYAENNYAGEMGLSRIAESHSPKRMDITAEMFNYWRQAFFQTLVEVDRDMSPELREAWEQVIDKGIAKIQGVETKKPTMA